MNRRNQKNNFIFLVTTALALPAFFLAPAAFAISSELDQTIQASLTYPRISEVSPSMGQKESLISYWKIDQDKTGLSRSYYLLEMDNLKNITTQIDHQPSIIFPSWSPSGNDFAYIKCVSSGCSLTLRNLKETYSSTPLNIDVDALKWAQDGQSIFLVGSKSEKKEAGNNVVKMINSDSTMGSPQSIEQISLLHSSAPSMKLISGLIGSINSLGMPTVDAGFDIHGNLLAYAHIPYNGDQWTDESHISLFNLETHQLIKNSYLESHITVDPKFSFDGKFLAFRQSIDSSNPVANKIDYAGKICVLNLLTQKVNCLSETFDSNPIILNWSADGQAIYVYETDYKTHGTQIYKLNALSNSIKPIRLTNDDGFIDFTTINLSADNQIGYGYETQQEAPEAYISDLTNWAPKKISHIQKSDPHNLGSMEPISWISDDGTKIEGILIKPANYQADKKYPLIVVGKGGPDGSWPERYIGGCYGLGEKIVPACWSVLLQQGFIVLLPNYRGSNGYGLSFFSSNYRHFNEAYSDIMSGVHFLINKNIADPKHMALFGWSYDGYTTAWALGHTNEFKVAVDGDGMTDLLSFTNTTDARNYLMNFYGQPYWQSDAYIKDSPIMYAKNYATPLLIIHGQDDSRVPLTQSLELNNALHLLNKPVKMITSPNTGHVPTDPNIVYKLTQEVTDWLEQAFNDPT